MDRLPPSRFVDEGSDSAGLRENTAYAGGNAAANGARHSHRASAMAGAGPQLSHLIHSPPQPPSLETHSSFGSTKYAASDLKSPMDEGDPSANALLPRDSAGNILYPGAHGAASGSGQGVTWAAAPRPSQYGHTVSYGDNGLQGSHPGVGQRSFSDAEGMRRKKSLVRPERERLNPDHRYMNYMQHAAVYEAEHTGRIGISATGHANHLQTLGMPLGGGQGGISAVGLAPGVDGRPGLRRGKSILAREEGMASESGLDFLKRGATLRRKKDKYGQTQEDLLKAKQNGSKLGVVEKVPLGPWMVYCYIITFWLPGKLLQSCGYKSLERRRAFREKIGLLSIVLGLMAAVGFLTFGFTDSVCNNSGLNFKAGRVQGGSMIFHGFDYAMDNFEHPAAAGITAGSNPLYTAWAAGGKDGSFLFQNVNRNCKGIIKRAPNNNAIPYNATTGDLGWYFPCNMFDQYGTSAVNQTGYATGSLCHTSSTARNMFAQSRYRNTSGIAWQGPVQYSWDNIRNSSRNLGVYKNSVLDFSLLKWLSRTYVDYPAIFDNLANGNTTFEGRDVTMQLLISGNRTMAECLDDIIRVGFVDSKSMGCIVADIVLYVSLVFILAAVGIKFFMAVIFSWFFGRRMGTYKKETDKDRQKRIDEVEAWTKDIYRPAPAKYRPNVKNARKSFLPATSRFTQNTVRPFSSYGDNKRPTSQFGSKGMLATGLKSSPPGTPLRQSKSNTSLPLSSHLGAHSRASSFDLLDSQGKPCPFMLDQHVVPQPTGDHQPFGFPLAHTLLLVTAYSESVEGLRTTLDSLATTDYPNSHKLILVIADGLVKGSGNSLTTPDIVLGMMKDLIVPREEVEALSYVAVADGHKRNNMAKCYAGWYDYDDETVESSKQQRVPMILIAKCGNPREAHDAKPGNRGKRDSQVLLMAFLQKVMFDERMTAFEYEFFNSIWRTAGITADNYEHVLMVDADTKVFPDSVTRMVACMTQDVEIMGLCGETKIANKKETWVTMIQVFEYYISHHQTKAFESMWGGVTCLPGCFSMYRIKAPKGPDGYWVPILANPDIVEHYSENVVDTLHKKNLLLLGEDRYLTTLMLKTFPRRKMMFCPQAYCKTIVPDTFRVLLSQRRRWINSTIHNLAELLLVRDLCGTFCFSMQFVVFMDLVGTLVLPAAIAFTLYVLIITCTPREPKPIIPLILLACILGLPGILIVVTSRKVAYVGWMAIYLLSLPIWNGILPAYAYFHMDDFSWGSTRQVEGEAKGAGHGDKDGEFDSSLITMKRWADWERERRWKNGTRSRDSTYEALYRNGSPHRSPNRMSMSSTSETFVSNPQDPFFRSPGSTGYATPPAGRRVDSVQVLELPAPLSATPQMQPFQHVPSSSEIYDAGDAANLHNYEASPYPSSSSENVHQVVSPRPEDDFYDSDSAEREAMLRRSSPDTYESTAASSAGLVVDTRVNGRTPSSMTATSRHARSPSVPASRSQRGVSLVDSGPVAAPDGALRTVQRNRRSSQAARNRQSGVGTDAPPTPTSPTYPLPPGAALPNR